MKAYYNEISKASVQTLKTLMDDGLIPKGDIDDRSITDVKADDLKGYTQCHFFAGIGGWPIALRKAGWPDDRPVWTGSAPCQPFSVAGKNLGYKDERHLAPTWLKLIDDRRPPICFGEQVASKPGRIWFSDLRAEVEKMGYASGCADLCAASVGAPHNRPRLFWGITNSKRDQKWWKEPHGRETRRVGRILESLPWSQHWTCALSSLRTLGDGVRHHVHFFDGPRNAIVPQVGSVFVISFMEALNGKIT